MIDSDTEDRNTQGRPVPRTGSPGDTAGVGPDAAADTPSLRALDRRVVTLWRVEGAIRTLFLTAIAFVVAGVVVASMAAAILITGLLALLSVAHALAWPPLRYRRWRFAIREDDVFLRYGVLWRATSVIPHRRLQHVDTERGPVERWLGLSRVIIFTAGSRGAQTTIPGLTRTDAVRLRDELGRLGQGDDAV